MFDFSAFYRDVAEQLPFGAVIAEVGVAEGASAIFLAETLLSIGKSFTFYLIDDLSYGRDSQLRSLLKNIGEADLGRFVEIVPVSSVEAACRFPDLHFDFVFIDASHKIEWTKADILLWYQKVKWNGTLAGHDYNSMEGIEVKMAVDLMFPNPSIVVKETEVDGKKIQFKEKILEIIPTDQGYNVWKVKKHPHLRLLT
jgi:hypothetical protein